jgi:hypothetical protein
LFGYGVKVQLTFDLEKFILVFSDKFYELVTVEFEYLCSIKGAIDHETPILQGPIRSQTVGDNEWALTFFTVVPVNGQRTVEFIQLFEQTRVYLLHLRAGGVIGVGVDLAEHGLLCLCHNFDFLFGYMVKVQLTFDIKKYFLKFFLVFFFFS